MATFCIDFYSSYLSTVAGIQPWKQEWKPISTAVWKGVNMNQLQKQCCKYPWISLRFVSYISLKDGLATKPFQNLKDYPFPLCVVCLCVVYKYHRIYQLRGHKISLALGGVTFFFIPPSFISSIRQSCPKTLPKRPYCMYGPQKAPFWKESSVAAPSRVLESRLRR